MFGLQTVLVKKKNNPNTSILFIWFSLTVSLFAENTFLLKWSGHILYIFLYFTSLERQPVCFHQAPSGWSVTPPILANKAVPNNTLGTGTQKRTPTYLYWHIIRMVHGTVLAGFVSHTIPRQGLEISAGQGHFLLVEGVWTPCFRRQVCLVVLEPSAGPGWL